MYQTFFCFKNFEVYSLRNFVDKEMLRTLTVKVENLGFGQLREIAQFRHKTVFPHPDIVEKFHTVKI